MFVGNLYGESAMVLPLDWTSDLASRLPRLVTRHRSTSAVTTLFREARSKWISSTLGLLPKNDLILRKIMAATALETLLLQAVQLIESELIVVVAATSIMTVMTTAILKETIIDTVLLKVTQLNASKVLSQHRSISNYPMAIGVTRVLINATDTVLNQAQVVLSELAVLLILVWKALLNIPLFPVLVIITTLASPATALYIPSDNDDQGSTFNHVEIITVTSTSRPSSIEIVVMILIGFLGLIILTPIMGFSDRKRVLNVSLVLASWIYWIVYGTGILPWSFIILWVYNMSNVLILLRTDAFDLGIGYNYFIAVFLASGFLDGILTTIFPNMEFWRALPHSTVTCMVFGRCTVKLLRLTWWEILSEATRQRLTIRAIPIFATPEAENPPISDLDRNAIPLEQGTHQLAIEATIVEN